MLFIDTQRKTLTLYSKKKSSVYTISTAENGLGEAEGSFKTPRSWHKISAKIGNNADINQVFIARKPTKELYSPQLAKNNPNRDWILTRILRLEGLITGFNKGYGVDTHKRFVYIHGCPPETDFSMSGSKGCIRVHPSDMISLFNQVSVGTPLLIY
jgi:lipoprotein-anchoring transpeptidase ErfK/SrfK